MSDTESITLTLTQESDYAFRITFEGSAVPALLRSEERRVGKEC